jgi:hypothetical protein
MTTAVTEELAAESLGFRRLQRLQRLGYECAEALAHGLRPGATEREAARTQRPWLRERGVRDRFHQPVACFGDGTAFVGSPRRSSFECAGLRRWAEDR